MHICCLNKEFRGLGYKPYPSSLYRNCAVTFELYQCKKCGKLYFKNHTFIQDDFVGPFNAKIRDLQLFGYKPLGQLITILGHRKEGSSNETL